MTRNKISFYSHIGQAEDVDLKRLVFDLMEHLKLEVVEVKDEYGHLMYYDFAKPEPTRWEMENE